MASLNWTKISDKFEASFNHAFASYKNRAHFDNLSEEFEIVAGANIPWSKLLLLDAIIHVLTNATLSGSPRRAFDQNKVLCECIISELRVIALEVHTDSQCNHKPLLSSNEVQPTTSPRSSHLTFTLQAPWDSMSNLRQSMLTGSPSEPTNKFDKLVDLLTAHPALRQHQFNIQQIVQTLVRKVIALFKSGGINPVSPPPTPPVVPVAPQVFVDPLINSTVSFAIRSHHNINNSAGISNTTKRKRDLKDVEEPINSDKTNITSDTGNTTTSSTSSTAERVSILKVREKKKKQSKKTAALKNKKNVLPPLQLTPPSICDPDDEECDNGLQGEGGARFDTEDRNFFMDSHKAPSSSSSFNKRPRQHASTGSSDEDDSKGSSTDGTGTGSDSGDNSGSCVSSLTDNSRQNNNTGGNQEGSPTSGNKPMKKRHHEVNAFITADPAGISYAMVDNVLCAVMPVTHPSSAHQQHQQHQQMATEESVSNSNDAIVKAKHNAECAAVVASSSVGGSGAQNEQFSRGDTNCSSEMAESMDRGAANSDQGETSADSGASSSVDVYRKNTTNECDVIKSGGQSPLTNGVSLSA